jgi:hypothetical protein
MPITEDKNLTIGIEIKAKTAEAEKAFETLKKVKQEAETGDEMPETGGAPARPHSEETKDHIKSLDGASEAVGKFQLAGGDIRTLTQGLAGDMTQLGEVMRQLSGPLQGLASALATVVSEMLEYEKQMKEMEDRSGPRRGRAAPQLEAATGGAGDELDAIREKMKAFQMRIDEADVPIPAQQNNRTPQTETAATAAQIPGQTSAIGDWPDTLGHAQTVAGQSRQTLEAASRVLTTVIANQSQQLELLRGLGQDASAQAQDIAATKRELAAVRAQMKSLIRGSYNT